MMIGMKMKNGNAKSIPRAQVFSLPYQVFKFRQAFTLVELLLVLAIIGIVTAITIPNFVQSMKGNRLRVATRTVVKSGRYARSIAVLKQVPITVTFDLTNSTVSVKGGEGNDNLTRRLDGVKIESIRTGEDDSFNSDAFSVVYHTNGRCQPYTLRIVDGDGNASEVQVDALATAKTRRSDE